MSIKALREEYARVYAEAENVISKAEQEGRKDLNESEKVANENRYARLAEINKQIVERSKFAKSGLANVAARPAEFDRQKFSKALNQWFRTGRMASEFATITTATQSGILLPTAVLNPLVTGAINSFREGFAAHGIPVLSTPGDTSKINIPVMDPTAGGLVAQNDSSENENAPSLAQSMVSEPATYESGSVYYSNLQLSAVRFDLLAATIPHLYNNKELGFEAAVAAALIADSGITQTVATATTSGFTYANSVSLANKLPKRCQQFKVRFLSAGAYAAAEGLVDDNNRPVMVSDPQNQTLRKMHGVPTIRCDYLEEFGATKVVGVELSLVGFHMRDAGEALARYENIPAKPNQTGLNLFGYHGYDWAVGAVAKLITPSS